MIPSELDALLAALPEDYQPVFGYPALAQRAQRACADRLVPVVAVHDALVAALGRPLRVLDLGCAQGYFSFELASRGASVRGVDQDEASIALCRSLAAEHPTLAVRFEVARLENVIAALEPGDVDLVLGLSVFHHLVHEEGFDPVRERLEALGAQVCALVLEVALASEPLYWAAAQPADPWAYFANFAFCHELSRHGTHLSAIERPLIVASRSHWVLPPDAGVIDVHLAEPHAWAKGHYRGSRRYFRSGDRLIKLFRFDVDPAFDNRGELAREAALLRAPPAGLPVPVLHEWQETERAGWLIREWLPGRLLPECLAAGDRALADQALRQLLDQLAALEAVGLYHEDLRAWNLLCLDDGASVRLIDYGSLREAPGDRAWPGNPWLSFIILVHEILNADIAHPEPLRTVALSPWGLPAPYRQWLAAFWERPFSAWSFAALRDALAAALAAPPTAVAEQPAQVRAVALEQGMTLLSRHGDYLHWCLRQQEAAAAAAAHELRGTRAGLRAAEERQEVQAGQLAQLESGLEAQTAIGAAVEDALAELREELRGELRQRGEALDALQRERDALLASASWRITAPLRAGVDLARAAPALVATGARRGLHGLARFVLQRPRLRALGLRILARLPWLQRRLERALLHGAPPARDDLRPGDDAPPPEALRRARHSLQSPADSPREHDES